jgi:hypothetical protein
MQEDIRLFRKRFFPNEMIHLKDDEILYRNDNLIITKWATLKPRLDIDHGISAYFMDEGYKVSKIYDKNHKLVYWYCDIIETQYNEQNSAYIFTDLIIDVLVYENGQVKVLDLGEVGDMLDFEVIDIKLASKAMHIADNLLNIIYNGKFNELQQVIHEAEANIKSKPWV